MLVDETLMEQNISEMQALANSFGAQLRPHIKTHKTPQIALRQISHGARGITCAKLGEAEVMVDGGVDDVLIAYPVVGRSQDQPAAGADGAGADDRRARHARSGRGALGGDVAARSLARCLRRGQHRPEPRRVSSRRRRGQARARYRPDAGPRRDRDHDPRGPRRHAAGRQDRRRRARGRREAGRDGRGDPPGRAVDHRGQRRLDPVLDVHAVGRRHHRDAARAPTSSATPPASGTGCTGRIVRGAGAGHRGQPPGQGPHASSTPARRRSRSTRATGIPATATSSVTRAASSTA